MKHLVVGAGEVGRALHAVLSEGEDEVAIRDVEAMFVNADVLHICIPWSAQFVAIVNNYVYEHEADLVVVHSTVPVGTCDQREWVHSPVRGKHPQLAAGLRTFVKHFGGERASEAAKAFDAMQIPTMVHSRARDLEAGKLWELVQYGAQILIQKQIHAWCEANDVDFDIAYTTMALTYNEGWGQLGHPEFFRPILEHVPGPIGGHCVRQNAALLDHPLAQYVSE